MNSIARMGILFAGIYALYRYRYRIMNNVLGNYWIRKIAVAISMNIPFVRNRMVNQVFR